MPMEETGARQRCKNRYKYGENENRADRKPWFHCAALLPEINDETDTRKQSEGYKYIPNQCRPVDLRQCAGGTRKFAWGNDYIKL